MSIGVHCPSCTSDFHVTPEFSGKLIRCPACKEPVRVPGDSESDQPQVSAPPKRAPKRANSSKSMKAAPQPQKPKPAASRPAVSRPAAKRSRSYESQTRVAAEAPVRRSAQADVARRNRKRNSQGNFPIGLAVGIGVGIAGLLIAFGAVLLSDTDDSLVADSGTPSATDTFTDDAAADRITDDITSPSQAIQNNDVGSNSSVDSQPPPAIASTQGNGPRMANFSASPDTSGMSPPNGSLGLPNSTQPSMERDSTGSTTSDAASSETGRPPILESWSDVNALVGPSIVRVDVRLSGGGSQGSGYVVDAEKGVAVTNYHVIEGALDSRILFENGDRIDVEGFLFLDSKRDIAILKFDPSRSTQAELRSLPLAAAHPLKGEEVAAFGAPIGLDFSMTQNIISAIRSEKDMAKMLGLTDLKGTWLQHGVSISSGNSGGPLINKRGEVVGMNTLGLTIGQNLNFAISGLDVLDGYNNQLPKLLAVSPRNAPVRHRSEGSAPDDSFDDPYERPEIQIVDVSGEDRGQELLAKMETLTILSIAFSDDPQGTVTGAVRTEARKTIDRCKIKLTSSRSADYVLLMVIRLERSGIKNTLRMTSEILTKDDDAREVLKIWELSEDVGTISLQSLYRSYLPPVLKKDIQKYFAKVRSELLDAKRNYKPKDDEEGKTDQD